MTKNGTATGGSVEIYILFGLIFANFLISGKFDQIILGMMLIAYRATNSLFIVQNRLQSFTATVGSLDVILNEVKHFDSRSRKIYQLNESNNNKHLDNKFLFEFDNGWLSLKNNNE